MPQTLRVVWIGSAALTLAALGLAPALGARPGARRCGRRGTGRPGTPFDHGKAADGQTKAALCAACHGPGGNSTNPEWPRLAGQSAIYIAAQLHMFKAATRVNPVMQPLVASLSDQDIDDLAVYFQSQTPLGLEADPSYWKAGEALYLRGDKDTERARLCRLPRPGRARQSRRRLPGAARAAVGLRREAAQRLCRWHALRRQPPSRSRTPNSVMMFTLAKRLSARADPRRGLLRAGHALISQGPHMTPTPRPGGPAPRCARARARSPPPPRPRRRRRRRRPRSRRAQRPAPEASAQSQIEQATHSQESADGAADAEHTAVSDASLEKITSAAGRHAAAAGQVAGRRQLQPAGARAADQRRPGQGRGAPRCSGWRARTATRSSPSCAPG